MVYIIIFLLFFYATVTLSMTITDKILAFSKSFCAFGILNIVASTTGLLFVSCNFIFYLTTVQKIFLLIPLSLVLCTGMAILVNHLPDKRKI